MACLATVDGRNPAPSGMYKSHGKFAISTGAGFQPSTVCHIHFQFWSVVPCFFSSLRTVNLALGSLTPLATLRTFQLLGEKSWLSGPGISRDDANICKLYD